MVSHATAGKSPVGGMAEHSPAATMRLPVSPVRPPALAAPAFCGNRKRALLSFEGSRFCPARAEKPSMAVAVAPRLSPELVLVSPDLRERAVASLPARDPDALFRVVPRPQPPRVEPQPPLPLAVAAYAAEAVVFGAIRGGVMVGAVAAASFVLAW
jgi:hypothetical protein